MLCNNQYFKLVSSNLHKFINYPKHCKYINAFYVCSTVLFVPWNKIKSQHLSVFQGLSVFCLIEILRWIRSSQVTSRPPFWRLGPHRLYNTNTLHQSENLWKKSYKNDFNRAINLSLVPAWKYQKDYQYYIMTSLILVIPTSPGRVFF